MDAEHHQFPGETAGLWIMEDSRLPQQLVNGKLLWINDLGRKALQRVPAQRKEHNHGLRSVALNPSLATCCPDKLEKIFPIPWALRFFMYQGGPMKLHNSETLWGSNEIFQIIFCKLKILGIYYLFHHHHRHWSNHGDVDGFWGNITGRIALYLTYSIQK